MAKINRTEYQRGKILALLSDSPLTAQQLADRLYITRDGANLHIKAMRADGQIHIAGWLMRPEGGQPTPQYTFGGGSDAVYVTTRQAVDQGRKTQVERTFNRVLSILKAQPMTVRELADILHLGAGRARFYTTALRKEKRIYVKAWRRVGPCMPAPVYAVGKRPDAQLAAKTPGDFYRARLADPDKAAIIKSRNKTRYLLQKLKKKPNTIFGALGL